MIETVLSMKQITDCNTIYSAADPGFLEGGGGLITIFTSGGGYWRGRAPPVTARGAGGAL